MASGNVLPGEREEPPIRLRARARCRRSAPVARSAPSGWWPAMWLPPMGSFWPTFLICCCTSGVWRH